MTHEAFLKRLSGRELPEMISRIATASFVPGGHRPQIKRGGIEMDRTAPFRFGVDNPKDYDWALSARVGRPMRKVRLEEKENLFVCLVDMRPSLSFGRTRSKRDFALEVAGILGISAMEFGDRAEIGALKPASFLPSRNGSRRKDTYLYHLLKLFDAPHEASELDIAKALYEAAGRIQPHTNVFVISDWLFPPPEKGMHAPLGRQPAYLRAEESLKALAFGRDVGIVALHDGCDFKLSPDVLRLKGGKRGMPVIIDGDSRKCQEALREIFRERSEWLDGLQRHLGVDYCMLETDTTFDYLAKLLAFFAKRKVR